MPQRLTPADSGRDKRLRLRETLARAPLHGDVRRRSRLFHDFVVLNALVMPSGIEDLMNGGDDKLRSVKVYVVGAVPGDDVRAVSRQAHQLTVERDALLFQLLDLLRADHL